MQSTGVTCVTATLWYAVSLLIMDLRYEIGTDVSRIFYHAKVMRQHLFAICWLSDALTLRLISIKHFCCSLLFCN